MIRPLRRWAELYNRGMASLYNDNVMRNGEKIGYYEGARFYGMDGKQVGYYENGRIYDENGYEKGYVEGDRVYRADGQVYDEVEKVRQHVSSGDYSDMPCAAVCLLFGWD